jgi:hypothetical protein
MKRLAAVLSRARRLLRIDLDEMYERRAQVGEGGT